MRLFRLKNRAGSCWWMVAPDLETAKQLSVKCLHARKPENVRLVGDQTDFYLRQAPDGTRRMLDAGICGTAAIQLPVREGGWILTRVGQGIVYDGRTHG